MARWEGENGSEVLPSNFLPSVTLMRTILFSFSGKFNLQLTATPDDRCHIKGGVLEPFLFDPSLSALGRMSPLCPSSCQCPAMGSPPSSSLHQSLVWPMSGGRCPQSCHFHLVHHLSSQVWCQALLTPLRALHWVPVYWIRHFINKHSGNRQLWQVKALRLLLIICWMQKWIWSDIQASRNYQ